VLSSHARAMAKKLALSPIYKCIHTGHIYIYIYIFLYVYIYIHICREAFAHYFQLYDMYGVAMVSRIDKIIGLFCRIWSLL